jgi:hypothetical protein
MHFLSPLERKCPSYYNHEQLVGLKLGVFVVRLAFNYIICQKELSIFLCYFRIYTYGFFGNYTLTLPPNTALPINAIT